MANIPVKYYSSTDIGAPQINTSNGDLTSMLDAVLVNGFSVRPVASITRDGNLATMTFSAGHPYRKEQVVRVDDVDQPEYAGDQRIVATTANTASFVVAGLPVTPATGTSISCRVAPLNFELVFAATHKRAYRSKNSLSKRPFLRVDDSQDPLYGAGFAKKGKVSIHESMQDVDTWAGAYAPCVNEQPRLGFDTTGTGRGVYDGWYKWYYARNQFSGGDYYDGRYNWGDYNSPPVGARSWTLIGDDRVFFLFIAPHDVAMGRSMYSFGDFDSFLPDDPYGSILTAVDAYVQAHQEGGYYATYPDWACNSANMLNYTGKVCMRDHTGTVSNARLAFTSLNNGSTISGNGGFPFPNGPNQGLVLNDVYLRQESGGHLRGRLPGIRWVSNDQPLSHMSLVNGAGAQAGRKFLIVATSHPGQQGGTPLGNTARYAFDVTGPWW